VDVGGGPEGHSREERSDNKPRGDDSPFIYLISVSADRSESHTHCSFFFRAFSRKNGEKKRGKEVDKAMRWIMHGIRIIVVVISSLVLTTRCFVGIIKKPSSSASVT
jgi:hypothetical protein